MNWLAARALPLVCVWAAACAHRDEGPAASVAAFGAAAARGDYAAAYALTSAAFRQRTPLAAFVADMSAAGADANELGRRLVAAAPGVPPRVEIDVGLGDTLPVVLEAGGWRVDATRLAAWGQATPRAALRTLIRAVDARRYDVVLRLVPRRFRAGLTVDDVRQRWEGAAGADNRAWIELLRGAATAPIVESGDEARLPYADHRELRFVREDNAWKVENPD